MAKKPVDEPTFKVPEGKVDFDFRGTGQTQDQFNRIYKAEWQRRVDEGMPRSQALAATDAEFDLIVGHDV